MHRGFSTARCWPCWMLRNKDVPYTQCMQTDWNTKIHWLCWVWDQLLILGPGFVANIRRRIFILNWSRDCDWLASASERSMNSENVGTNEPKFISSCPICICIKTITTIEAWLLLLIMLMPVSNGVRPCCWDIVVLLLTSWFNTFHLHYFITSRFVPNDNVPRWFSQLVRCCSYCQNSWVMFRFLRNSENIFLQMSLF